MAGGPPAGDQDYVAIPRRALAAAVLVVANFMVVLDLTVANVSVPHIAGSLGVSLDQGTWIITSYSVSEAISVPLTGWLAGRFGPVRIFVVVMTGFAAFSMLCGLSVTLQMIIVARIGQGICGGLLMPLGQTLLLRIYPPHERNKGMLLFTTTLLLGPALGPNIGGFISDNFSWHWIFLINIPIAIVCIALGFVLLKPAEQQPVKGPIDAIGLALLVFWIGSLQIMLDVGRTHDWFEDPLIVTLAVFAIVGFCAFLIWELTEDHPIVDIRVFRHRGFSFGVLALALSFGAYFASIVLIPQWLQTWMGYPATMAGFITACTGIAALSTSPFAGKALRTFDPRLLVSGAVFWLACMSLMRSGWTTGADFWTLVMPQLVQGFGLAFFMLPLTTISLGSVLPHETASAAGLQNFVRTISIGISTALAVALMDNTQQAAHVELASRLQPGDTMGTLANAGFSDQASLQYIAYLVDREAVMMGVNYVFAASALVFFLSAAVIWLAPKPKPPQK